jgi:hypothetical protein
MDEPTQLGMDLADPFFPPGSSALELASSRCSRGTHVDRLVRLGYRRACSVDGTGANRLTVVVSNAAHGLARTLIYRLGLRRQRDAT